MNEVEVKEIREKMGISKERFAKLLGVTARTVQNWEPKLDEDYILEPFPNDQFIPDAWQDVLATVDVCVNEVTPTVFCDEEGYDIVPVHMVRVLSLNEAGLLVPVMVILPNLVQFSPSRE